MEMAYPAGARASSSRYLRVLCTNKPLPFLARWMARNPALGCHGIVCFYQHDGRKVFIQMMRLRWSSTPEPLPLQVAINGHFGQIFDPVRMGIDSNIDIQPGISQPLDVVVKFDGEADCYGWNNESYFSDPPWRNPGWRLPQGKYFVKVVVTSAGQRCERAFELLNGARPEDFKLEECLPDATPELTV